MQELAEDNNYRMIQSNQPYIIVPTWRNGVWGETHFGTRDEFKDFATPLFKEPGKYEFNETSFAFNEQAQIFNKQGFYCNSPFRSKDFVHYWDDQKAKCRFGALFISGSKQWYLPREYYMWLNFLPIYDKEESKFGFIKIRDAQYHVALHRLLCELNYEHFSLVKKRQMAISYYWASVVINLIYFEEGVPIKIGASDKKYLDDVNGFWKYMNQFKNFLNKETAWYRPFNPEKPLSWKQEIEVTENGRKTFKGLGGTAYGISFEKDPTAGVAGPVKVFYYEEGGIAPTADKTYGYMGPAMRSGMITTGLFAIAGSVGELTQCGPLKEYVLHPKANGFRSVTSNLIDAKGTIGETGLFVPEQWSMPPFIDKYGNSEVEEALKALDAEFARLEKDLTPEAYQLAISQRPRNLEEAFAAREESKFPLNYLNAQESRINEKLYPREHLDIIYNAKGKPEWKETRKLPISDFPVSKKSANKEGVVVVYERPEENPTWGTYYASIDPVSEGKTTTSDSLCSIYIMRNAVQVTRIENNKTSTHIKREKMMASWCGRFDDINKTHERLELLIEMYNAWAIIENNISLFIQHMIARRKQKYLVPKTQILFLKDLQANKNVFQEYGWKNVGTIFRVHLLNYVIEFLKEEIDNETLDDGTVVKTTYGVERIPDLMLVKEMQAYTDDLNVDRLVAFSALIAFMKIQTANRGYLTQVERIDNKELDKSRNLLKLDKNPFSNMGNSSSKNKKPFRSPFKNIR